MVKSEKSGGLARLWPGVEAVAALPPCSRKSSGQKNEVLERRVKHALQAPHRSSSKPPKSCFLEVGEDHHTRNQKEKSDKHSKNHVQDMDWISPACQQKFSLAKRSE